MTIADLAKNYFNSSEKPPVYYWRDSTGNEIDCLIDTGTKVKSIEIKSSSTVTSDFFRGLDFYRQLNPNAESYLVYGGNTDGIRKNGRVFAWNNTNELLNIKNNV